MTDTDTHPDALAQGAADLHAGRLIAETMALVLGAMAPQRRIVHAGDRLHQAGEPFRCLSILNAGLVKIVHLRHDGREQVVGLKFRGDWLGFDGIAQQCHTCDTVAMDTGEVWLLPYDALLEACTRTPQLLSLLHQAMSREIGRDREALMSVCTLPADARVAGFLRDWAQALAGHGQRTDQITLRLTRAEIGNYLGLTLETVSRSLTRLARAGLIGFTTVGRRDICIPDRAALAAHVQASLGGGGRTEQSSRAACDLVKVPAIQRDSALCKPSSWQMARASSSRVHGLRSSAQGAGA